MTDTDPIACSLDGVELEARLGAMRDAGRGVLISRERQGRCHLLRFRAEPATRGHLEEIVSAERRCCPFLGLALEEQEDVILLSIEAPAGAEETADALAAAFDAAAQ
jgi:hypothetical protein